jgi:protein SCO1/2
MRQGAAADMKAMRLTWPSFGPAVLVALLLAGLAGVAGAWLGKASLGSDPGRQLEESGLRAATLLPRPKPLKPFTLVDDEGRPFNLANLRGHWSFLAIGYTSCPDICPTTLATFRALSQQIAPKGGKPAAQFLFVSVDPQRDTPRRLGDYVHYFDPHFLGVTGTDEQLEKLTTQLGLPYARVQDRDSAMGYLVDHSAAVVLIDPRARLTAVFSRAQDPKAMAEDFSAIKAAMKPSS